MSGAERRCVEEAFDSNIIAPLGPMVDRFEKAICESLGKSSKGCRGTRGYNATSETDEAGWTERWG